MPTIEEFEQWLTTSQAATELGITKQGIHLMLANKKLRAAKTRRGWLIDPASVQRLKEERAGGG